MSMFDDDAELIFARIKNVLHRLALNSGEWQAADRRRNWCGARARLQSLATTTSTHGWMECWRKDGSVIDESTAQPQFRPSGRQLVRVATAEGRLGWR